MCRLVFPPHAGFPWCRCHDYLNTSSPYTLELASKGLVPGRLEADFVLKTVTPVAPLYSPCYEALLKGLAKLQIQTSESGVYCSCSCPRLNLNWTCRAVTAHACFLSRPAQLVNHVDWARGAELQ